MARNPAHEALRSATAECHRRVDEIYSEADLGDRQSYGNFLRAQAAALLPAEQALERAGIAEFIDDWAARVRGHLLADDLAALGLAIPRPAGSLSIGAPAQLLGVLYMLEGSRLGGTLLKRSVSADLPATFLGGFRPGSWQSLLALLDQRLDTEVRQVDAIDAARDAFSLFENGGRRFLEKPRTSVGVFSGIDEAGPHKSDLASQSRSSEMESVREQFC